MESMYFPDATVFSPAGTHSETARLTLARRLRQFAEEKSHRSAEVGSIDVSIMDDVAIATYPYEFRLSSIGKDGSLVDIHVPYSAATQVFLRDKGGFLRIAHEHLAAVDPGRKTPVGRPGPSVPEALMPRTSAPGTAKASSGGSLPPADSLLTEQVRSEIRKYWQMFRSKNKEGIERMFSPTAIAWPIGVKRGTSARLVLAAKAREVLGPQSAVNADLGSIDVRTLTKNVAVASYSLHYRIIVVQRYGKRADTDTPFQGRRHMVDCPSARETQVFERDKTGVLQIVHDHMSISGIPIYTELPMMDAETAKV
jgi:ketosteroid isomerase-like protein